VHTRPQMTTDRLEGATRRSARAFTTIAALPRFDQGRRRGARSARGRRLLQGKEIIRAKAPAYGKADTVLPPSHDRRRTFPDA
ncbi:hypothetical protein, partial [Enterobacter hormaechei]|uniref:hypothetical protein n=1 Tax=Enterobacter hormaechei TaxID=158836 RepID=UPI001952EF99